MEIGPRIAEQRPDIGARQQDGGYLDALWGVRERYDERCNGTVADQTAHRKREHASIEDRLDQLDGFRCSALPAGFEVAADIGADAVDRGILIADRRTKW